MDLPITHALTESLARSTDGRARKSVIVAGAGAVENAWQPVLKALEPWYGFPLDPDGANLYLARAIYLLRWWGSEHGEEGKQELQSLLRKHAAIKNDIARELMHAEETGQIKARRSLALLMEKLVVEYGSSFGLVTTNWDTVVPKAIISALGPAYTERVQAHHLHGSLAAPDTLRFPSETSREAYQQCRAENELGFMHRMALERIAGAQRTILYGLSLNPLDAELTQVLSEAWSGSVTEEIFIVDLQERHKEIAGRVNLLLDKTSLARVVGIDPETMVEMEDYTVRGPCHPQFRNDGLPYRRHLH